MRNYALAYVSVRVISERARAKVNLYLHIVGRRADGHHLLESLVVFADLADTIIMKKPDGNFNVQFAGDFSNIDYHNNTVRKSGIAIAELCKIDPRGTFIVHKDIPVGAGLGGASANACAAIKLFLRVWNVALPSDEVERLAFSIGGADGPVCWKDQSAIVLGVGDQVLDLPSIPMMHAILIWPHKPLFTKAVFDKFASDGVAFDECHNSFPDERVVLCQMMNGRNSLFDVASTLEPSTANALNALSKSEGCYLARMTGSGSACFGLFAEPQSAVSAAKALSKAGYWARYAILGGVKPACRH